MRRNKLQPPLPNSEESLASNAPASFESQTPTGILNININTGTGAGFSPSESKSQSASTLAKNEVDHPQSFPALIYLAAKLLSPAALVSGAWTILFLLIFGYRFYKEPIKNWDWETVLWLLLLSGVMLVALVIGLGVFLVGAWIQNKLLLDRYRG